MKRKKRKEKVSFELKLVSSSSTTSIGYKQANEKGGELNEIKTHLSGYEPASSWPTRE